MREYIDRIPLIGMLIDKQFESQTSTIEIAEVIRMVNSQPIIDKELKQGYWNKDDCGFKCSECSGVLETIHPSEYPFCPYCDSQNDVG